MSAFINDPERNVIPRWLSFDSASKAGELDSASNLVPRKISCDLESLIDDWRISNSLTTACDAVGVAYTAGRGGSVVQIAREILKRGAPTPIVERICSNCIAARTSSDDRLGDAYGLPDVAEIANRIRVYKLRLAEFPWNAVLWTNLALLYTTLGQNRSALKAIRVAQAIAPDDRFVLRANARFHLHCGDPEQARSILHATARLRSDPWLLANEIALSQVLGQASNLVRLGRRFIENELAAPFHLSELNSSLSTLEFTAGNVRKARRHCSASLQKPAENAIAQAAWIERKSAQSIAAINHEHLGCSQEAKTWYHYANGDWRMSLDASMKWQWQEPFSSRPAVQGGYIAITALEEYETAIRILSFAERSNPDDPVLLNNLAFAYACMGDTEEADAILEKAARASSQNRQQIVLMATKGLIEHRRGNPQAGELLYSSAISRADAAGHTEIAKTARIFSLLEQLRDPSRADRISLLEQANTTSRTLRDDSMRMLFTEKVARAANSNVTLVAKD